MSESDTYDTDSDGVDNVNDSNEAESVNDEAESVEVAGETFTNMNAILQDILKQQTETNRVSWAKNYWLLN